MWSLLTDRVTWHCGTFEGEWIPRQPEAGMQHRFDEHRSDRLGAVWFDAWDQVPPSPPELYRRQNDLIVSYQQGSGDELRCQLQWQLVPLGSFGYGIDLLLSAQTNLLNAMPAVTISSRIPTDQVWLAQGDPQTESLSSWSRVSRIEDTDSCTAILVRYPGGPSYVEMVHPADVETISSCKDRNFSLGGSGDGSREISSRRRFFTEPLEKGVIRRARWRCGWISNEDDEYFAALAYADLLRRALPLTT
ncbi:MAG: hypothetical protein O3C60_13860 [Planctomycetota bacterium]|nr:hypothetical protein [Planctomycetota bacterium]